MSKRLQLVGALGGLLVVLAGCSSSPAESVSLGDNETASSISTGPAAAVAGTSGAASSSLSAATSGTAAPAVVPVTTTTGTGGTPRVVVEISVGGGALFPVILDTGSSGLLVDSTAVGSEVNSTGALSYSKQYVGAALSGSLVQAPVTIGSVTTPPIGVVTYDAATAPAGLTSGVARGIMGIASEGASGAVPPLYSPAMQLPAPYGDMSTLDVAQQGAGTWTLGPVATPVGATNVPLQPVSGAASGTLNAWAKDLQLCWTFPGAAATCGDTDLDSGAANILVNSTSAAASAASAAAAGAPVTVGVSGAGPLWSFSIGEDGKLSEVSVDSLGDATEFNTGLSFFYDHVVSFDYANGQALLSAK